MQMSATTRQPNFGTKLETDCMRHAKQVSLCFHSTDSITLPEWIMEAGRVNPDLFYTDKAGGRNTECLTLGVNDGGLHSGRHQRCMHVRRCAVRYSMWPH